MADADHSLYVRVSDRGIVVITMYVDDLIVGGDKEDEIEHVKRILRQKFEIKDLGDLCYFLGIEIICTPDGIWMSQRQYAMDIFSKYGMTYCKPISMPLDQNGKMSTDAGCVLEDPTMYRKMVGSLIYITISKPDLSYAVGLVSQYMKVLRKPHLDCVRHILRYFRATVDYALFYATHVPLHVYGYTDGDWAGSVFEQAIYKQFYVLIW